MSKHFILLSDDRCPQRIVMNMGADRAMLFYDIVQMTGKKLVLDCGIEDFSNRDEFYVEGTTFTSFFEAFMQQHWEGDGIEHLWNWAEYAAGMIWNISLESRFWKQRGGVALSPIRCQLYEKELEDELLRKTITFNHRQKKLPLHPHPAFTQLKRNQYACLIESLAVVTSTSL